MPDEEKPMEQILGERLQKLPLPVQKAITSSKVEEHLRELSEQHKLHLDQWQILENQVMMTLLGMQPAEELENNIIDEVGADEETARALASDIALNVFDPIRKQLEQNLDHPSAEPEESEPMEDMRAQILSKADQGGEPAQEYEAETTPGADEPEAPPQQPEPTPQEGPPETDTSTQQPSENTQRPAPEPHTSEDIQYQQQAAPQTPQEPQQKVKRAPASDAYTGGTSSFERRDVAGDPYRESIEDEE